ncbi:hydroxycinnamoyltransferase 4-like [Lolium rigidum]|uniref:hydroxycinnamoyltransferase 4-like n=1 Tax=Lolium rigidum TaxID=89674 RepID=UPI001F5D88E1|nr:hydroxycinnamoyltransferase 4-like [Lolium rigidum]
MGINVIRSELVRPSEDTPHGPFWLSNLDLGVRSGYSPTIYLFRPRHDDRSGFFSADVLRTALAMALVLFYPLAGRLGMAPDGRVEIDCNGEGAVFVVAESDVVLDDLEDFMPSKAMSDMFVPPYEKEVGPGAPLLLLQVSLVRGGVVLGTGMHHYALDGRSSFHFMQTWSSMARGATGAVVAPFLDRRAPQARSPPVILFDHSHEYCQNAGYATSARPSELIGVIMRVTNAQAAALRAHTGESLFRSLVAHIWRCTLMARALAPDAKSRLYTVVDMRARLSPPLPSAYFGNAGVRTSVSAKVGDLLANPLKFGAQQLRMATNQGDEYARSTVDYLEMADERSKPGRELPDTDLRVISWMGMVSHDADFGWGEPALVAPAAMSYTWFIYNIGNSGDVAVAVAMKPDHLARFKELFFDENEMTW